MSSVPVFRNGSVRVKEYQTSGAMIVICPYCDAEAKLVSGDVVFPHRPDLKNKHFYRCEPCSARVGCHPGTTTPMGSLASKELRYQRSLAHLALDALWKRNYMTRQEAYLWLAQEFGASTHIGQSDEATCRKIRQLANEYRRKADEC